MKGSPPLAGESRFQRGRGLKGGRRPLRGLRHQGARELPPLLLLTMRRTEPRKGALSPQVLERGKRRQAADPR